jgi:hypothetical protein
MTSHEPQALSGRREFAEAASSLVGNGLRYIDLLSYQLEHDAYGVQDFVNPVKRLLLGSPMARLRVLLNQPRLAVGRGHALIELGRQMTSQIEFRELLGERCNDCRGELLIVDRRGLLIRREQGDLDAALWRDAPDRGKQKSEYFDSIWAESPPAQDLRSLGI